MEGLKATQALITSTIDGIIVSVTHDASFLFGYLDPEELIGQNVRVLIPSPYKEQHDTYMATYAKTKVKKILGSGRFVEAQHKNGEKFPILLHVADLNEKYYVATIQRLSETATILCVSKEGIILSSSQASTFGFEDADLIGKNVSILVPSPWKVRHGDYIRMYEASRSSHIVGHLRNLALETKAQTKVPVSLAVTEMISLHGEQQYQVRIDPIDPSIELVFTLSATGTIVSCNIAYVTALLGYSGPELLHKSIALIVPELVKSSGDPYPLVVGSPATYNAYHKDGSTLEVTAVVHPFKMCDVEMFSCRISRHSVLGHAHSSIANEEQELFSDITLGPVLGKGSFGVVRLATVCVTKQVVAAKLLTKTDSQLMRIQSEMSIFQQLHHENIPTLYKIVDAPTVVAVVMEYCGGGTLLDYVKLHQRLMDKEAKHYFKQLVSVVSYIHGMNVIHRDIKAENILMLLQADWRENVIKLCDFGLSAHAQVEKMHTTFCGTPAYAAPEMILCDAYAGPQVDVWSMGIVLFFMLVGRHPFSNVAAIINSSLTIPALVDPSGALLIECCLKKDTANRIMVAQMDAHPWLIGKSIETTERPTHPTHAIPATEVLEVSSASSLFGGTISSGDTNKDSQGTPVKRTKWETNQ